MRKIILGLLFCISTQFAVAAPPYPASDEISIYEHWISFTKSYDIETATQKLGSLYRRFFSLVLTYDFYDSLGAKTAIAEGRLFSFGVHLDVYNELTKAFLGSVEEKLFTFFPTFDVIGSDKMTKVAQARMNFWGTVFVITDPATSEPMVTMTRPFFRLKNDWKIQVTNRSLLDQKNMDWRLLFTLLAVQGEIEDWEREYYERKNDKRLAAEKTYAGLAQKIATISQTLKLKNLAKPSEKSLEALAVEIDTGFEANHPANLHQSNAELVTDFTNYCLDLLKSDLLPDSKKQALISLLNMRLQGHN